MIKHRLIIEYHKKGNNNSQVATLCGCSRMTGYTHWYNLDLPETMAVREKLLPETGAISQLAMSAMDNPPWIIGAKRLQKRIFLYLS